MVRIIRHVGIAIGSFVAAWLVVWFIGGALLPAIGIPIRPLDPGATSAGSALAGLVTFVLGGLIYRDIIRKERRLDRSTP